MPVRNTLLQLILLAIPLASASLVDLPTSNSTVGMTAGSIHASSSSITSLTTLLVSAAPSTDANVAEMAENKIPGTVNSTVNEMTLSSGGLPTGDISIKKGGGAAGSHGGGFSGGGGSGGRIGSSGSSGGRGGSGGINEIGGGTGLMTSSASSTRHGEVWFPLGGGLFDPPSWAGAVGGPVIVTRAMALAGATVLIVCGML